MNDLDTLLIISRLYRAPQHLMPRYDLLQGIAHTRDTGAAIQFKYTRYMIGICPPFILFDEPQPLLRKGEHSPANRRRGYPHLLLPHTMRQQLRDRPVPEDIGYLHLRSQHLAHPV